MGETEQKPAYRQIYPLKMQRDQLFEQCESVQDRQRWYAKVGRKGYMHEHRANRMFANFCLLAENSGLTRAQQWELYMTALGGQYPAKKEGK